MYVRTSVCRDIRAGSDRRGCVGAVQSRCLQEQAAVQRTQRNDYDHGAGGP